MFYCIVIVIIIIIIIIIIISLCWGFTAQSTRWGHVERCQFT